MICQKRKRKDKTEYRKYICKTYHSKGRQFCDQPNIDVDWAENKVIESLRDIILTKLTTEQEGLNEDQAYETLINKLDEIEERINQIELDTVNLIKAKEILSEELFNTTAQKFSKDYECLLKDKEYILCKLKNIDEMTLMMREEMKEWLEIDNPSHEELREFIEVFVEKVEVIEEKLNLHYRFHQIFSFPFVNLD